MSLDLQYVRSFGPAIPEAFVARYLEDYIAKKHKLTAKTSREEEKALEEQWELIRTKLQKTRISGQERLVRNRVIDPLVPTLGFDRVEAAPDVETREGEESGGFVLVSKGEKARLRAWTVELDTDLDAPNRRGRAYRFSPTRIAQRVLLATGERAGLLTNGYDLRLLICDPARPDSHLEFDLQRWRQCRAIPDEFRLLLLLASPKGIAALPDIVEEARLKQSEVTRDLRHQARRAVEHFIQNVIDQPSNAARIAARGDKAALARQLWNEGLVLVYRLLFLLKLESSADPSRAFSFASTTLWRNTYSPSVAMARLIERRTKEGIETGRMLETGMRQLFKMFVKGLRSSELQVPALGGALFGSGSTPLLDELVWGEDGVHALLENLLWTPPKKKTDTKLRVHYGGLDVEDLGRVYEALLELEAGITDAPMCRLRRDKLEVVVPVEQGLRYQNAEPGSSKVEFVEPIEPGRFFLRVGLGRKASGSYYTPDPFVKFLVQETLGPQCAERSPLDDPQPLRMLGLKVLDPAMGSGHFLVEACRFLGEKLYEACRRCDELATETEQAGDTERAMELRQRVGDLPDPNDELLSYLPSSAPEGGDSGLSQMKALALCRRLVAVHCLYGVDKNPLAVELAKLVLWLESYAEGYPLTFLDHRLVCGDSLTGPFFKHLTTFPISGKPFDDLWTKGLHEQLSRKLSVALKEVAELEKSIGMDLADLGAKSAAKGRLDDLLADLRMLAAAWSGAVMLGKDYPGEIEAAYEEAVQTIANDLGVGREGHRLEVLREQNPHLDAIVRAGAEGVAYDLKFPEVFYPDGRVSAPQGFHAVLGNPPWNKTNLELQEFMGGIDFRFIDSKGGRELENLTREYQGSTQWKLWEAANAEDGALQRITGLLYPLCSESAGGFGSGHTDVFASFVERSLSQIRSSGAFGMVIPSAMHVSKSLRELRRNVFGQMKIGCYYCFENKKDIFEIHNSWKFTPFVFFRRSGKGSEFPAQFYLHDLGYLFSPEKSPPPIRYSYELIEAMDPETLVFAEFTEPITVECLRVMMKRSQTWGRYSLINSWDIRRELNPTDDKDRIRFDVGAPPFLGFQSRQLIFHLPGTMHQYMDSWEGSSRGLVPLDRLADKKTILSACRYYRAAYRTTGRATDERTSIYALLPPLTTATNNLPIEGKPHLRSNAFSLYSIGVCNSFSFDFSLRLRVGSKSISKFIMSIAPMPEVGDSASFLAHSALRLTCNHEGYAPLWREQLGDRWDEPRKARYDWPVLGRLKGPRREGEHKVEVRWEWDAAGEDERWEVRAAIDAVLAQAYGLTRDQYEHVLSTFSHKSYPKAPTLCLAMFDELQALGLETFTKKYDPYHDVPLNTNLPQPVIELPDQIAAPAAKRADDDFAGLPLFEAQEEEEPCVAKVVEVPVRWVIHWQEALLSQLVELAMTADPLHKPVKKRPHGLVVDSSGAVWTGKPSPEGVVERVRSARVLTPAEIGRFEGLFADLEDGGNGTPEADEQARIETLLIEREKLPPIQLYATEGEWSDFVGEAAAGLGEMMSQLAEQLTPKK